MENFGTGHEEKSWLETPTEEKILLKKLKQTGILRRFPSTNNVLTGKNKIFSGAKPVMENVPLGKSIVDIYEVGGGCLYLHIKD